MGLVKRISSVQATFWIGRRKHLHRFTRERLANVGLVVLEPFHLLLSIASNTLGDDVDLGVRNAILLHLL